MSTTPIGEPMLWHPWISRTGRGYYQDLGGDAFKLHEKIMIGGQVYVKHSMMRVTYENGQKVIGPREYFWEHVPKPLFPQSARRLD